MHCGLPEENDRRNGSEGPDSDVQTRLPSSAIESVERTSHVADGLKRWFVGHTYWLGQRNLPSFQLVRSRSDCIGWFSEVDSKLSQRQCVSESVSYENIIFRMERRRDDRRRERRESGEPIQVASGCSCRYHAVQRGMNRPPCLQVQTLWLRSNGSASYWVSSAWPVGESV